jgi:cytochrome c
MLLVAIAAALGGCGTSSSPTNNDAGPTNGDSGMTQGDAAVPSTFAEQVALGMTIYGANCASCHGAGGEGGTGPRLVGLDMGALPLEPREGAARTTDFVTVADVATFAVSAMPPAAPGSLSAEEYWAVLAFDLSANGIDLDEKLTPELAETLTIPRGPSTFAEQVELGGTTYAANCASCHGAGGEGGTGPRLVGLDMGALPLEPREGSARTTQFVTVADVATFAVSAMPPTAPGSLSADEYWAIVAFDLSANGITLPEKLTPELAATLTIPR